jgi:peptidyl-prolyl cis-trans isomerase D
MLQAMRQASKSLVMKIILTLLALTFVVFFGNSFVGDGGPSGAGSIVQVGDVDFNAYEINQAFNQRLQQAQTDPRLAGLTQQQAIQLGLLDQTIDQLVTRTLFDLGARDLGIGASDADASALVRQVPQFQNTAGRFDRIQFESYLRANGLSEQQYINQLRGDIERSQLIGTLASGVKAPAYLTERFFNYNAEGRVAEFLVVESTAVPAVAAPDDAELATFYEANKALFETPEYRSGILVSLTLEDFAREIGIADADIAAVYETNKARYSEPERRQIESALFPSKEAADIAAARIRSGEDFAAVVGDVTGSPPADLGLVARDATVVDEIGAAAFALAEPGLAGPFESPFGWNLAQVGEIVPRSEQTLADVRDDIAHELALGEARERIFDVLESFEDALAGGATLEEAAAKTGLKAQSIGPLSGTGASPSAAAPENPDRQMLTTLFTTPDGQPSAVVERNNGGFFALRVDQIEAPRIPPLTDIRDRVVAAWGDQMRAEAADRVAGEIAEQARASGSLIAAAAKAGYTATATEPFDRGGADSGMPIEAVDLLFEAQQGDVVTGVTDGGAIVAKLTDIVAPPADAAERERVSEAIAQSMVNDLQAQLANALRSDYAVEIDNAELQRQYTTQ